MVERVCKYCKKDFSVYPSLVKRGGGIFCSRSCSTTYRNLTDNPAKKVEVRRKISANHADVSGKNNPMYGKSGKLAPGYIDGRSKTRGRKSRRIGLTNLEHKCNSCGETKLNILDIHHKDGNHSNNELSNLVVLCRNCHMTKAHIRLRDEKGKFVGSLLSEDI